LIKLFNIIGENPLVEAPFLDNFAYIKSDSLLKAENKEHRALLIEIIKSYMFKKESRSNKLC